MDEESFQHGQKKQLFNQIKNSKLLSSAQYCKNQVLRIQQDNVLQVQGHIKPPKQNLSGGDADRMIRDTNNSGGTYRRNNDSSFIHQVQVKTNKQLTTPLPPCSMNQKYRQESSNSYDMYETDSNFGGGLCSESGKSQKSSKSVVSKKSSQEMRKMVTSQCKLHEVIDKTLKQMCGAEGDNAEFLLPLKEPLASTSQRRSNRCSDLLNLRCSQNEVISENTKGNVGETRSGDALTISVDDVINSKVINPMIRKLQRMYLNNLKEEMSLMEDLERLPHKVNEVYKATIFKQKQ